MPKIKIEYQGKVYEREVFSNFLGHYFMRSKGVLYRFKRNPEKHHKLNSWLLVQDSDEPPTSIPYEFLKLISDELDKLTFSSRG